MDSQYHYSIIIPHKNIPRLLQRCLDSIPQRKDLQVIVVDDNSDPSIVDFDNFPGKDRSDTTVVFDKSGKGAGRARNIGLDHAKGKWLLFADADDVFEPGIREVLAYLATSHSDIVYFKACSRHSVSLEATNEANSLNEVLANNDNFSLRYKLLVPWMKAIKKDLVVKHEIRFEEVPWGNDTYFSAMCGYYAESVSVNNNIGYCWMQRTDSLWRKKNAQGCIIRHQTCRRISEFMKERNESEAYSLFSQYAIYHLVELGTCSPFRMVRAGLNDAIVTRDCKVLFLVLRNFASIQVKRFFRLLRCA